MLTQKQIDDIRIAHKEQVVGMEKGYEVVTLNPKIAAELLDMAETLLAVEWAIDKKDTSYGVALAAYRERGNK